LIVLAVMALTVAGGHAQVAPAATQPLAVSAFGGVNGALTGLHGGHNIGIMAGADLDFRSHQFFSLQPALEVRGTYPVEFGHFVGEKNVLGGLRESGIYGRLRPYGDLLFGLGRLAYVHGAPNPKGTFLYLHSSSFVIAPAAGAELRITDRFALKADFQFARYSTPVNSSGNLFAETLTAGVVYRFDRNHKAGRQLR
jgi:hypothetical protein